MMPFTIKQNDTSPSVEARLKQADGTVVDLTNASVNFHMKSLDGVVKVSAAAAISDATNGVVQYDWEASDTTDVGTYYAEFQVTYPDNSVETFPNNDNLSVVIRSELN